jgi:alpha-tubulin suppressor-like RCC1 family protein
VDENDFGFFSFFFLQLIPTVEGIRMKKCAAGLATSFLLSADGAVYSFGYQKFTGRQVCSLLYPHRPEVMSFFVERGLTVVDVASGSEHCLALTACNRLFAWGRDVENQCGLGDEHLAESVAVPQEVVFPAGTRIAKISAGTKHSSATCFAEPESAKTVVKRDRRVLEHVGGSSRCGFSGPTSPVLPVTGQ